MPSLTNRATNAKKKTLRSTQAATERVQKLRGEYWEQVKQIEPLNLVFLDETGVLLGLTRTHARSPRGSRAYDLKPFYRGAKVTVIGAISLTGVVALMTLDGAMDGDAFQVFIEKCLVPQLWAGAVVVMDNLLFSQDSCYQTNDSSCWCKRAFFITEFLQILIRLNYGGHNSNLSYVNFPLPLAYMVDILIATALDLINPKHLRNWFTNCCYCTQ